MKNTPTFFLAATFLLAPLFIGQAAEPAPTQLPRTQFLQDQPWPDDKGIHINAHAGGVMFHDGVYYWFGESYADKKNPAPQQTGVHCYSSKDLLNWKDEGVVLGRVKDPKSDITEGSLIERPKVIYNAKTGKFVMWFHLELSGQGYRAARSGVAVSDTPTGPYTYLHSERPDAGVWPLNVTEKQKEGGNDAETLKKMTFVGGPNAETPKHNILVRDFPGGQMARDMNLFVDEDGKAYHVFSSEENSTLHISQLSDDYLSHSGKWIRIFEHRWNEAPALFKHDGKYWLISSGCSDWDPNTARLAVADSILGSWKELPNPLTDGTLPKATPRTTIEQWKKLGQPSVGGDGKNNLGAGKTFGGQSTCVLPIQGKPGAFIAMFDIWRPKDQTTSAYVWLPVVFEGKNGNSLSIPWRNGWDLSVFDKSQGQ
jgi:hypothetical protein